MKLNRVLNTILLPFRSVYSFVTPIFRVKFLILFLFAAFFVYSLPFFDDSVEDLGAQTTTLPNCDTLAASVDADPGVNCRYRNLPLCTGSGAPSSPQHRVNCFDVVDLPICEQIASPSDRDPMKNCARLCSDTFFSSSNPAIFNQNCVRFCDDMPAGMAASVGSNCIQRGCHQLPIATEPRASGTSGANCNMFRCDRLWPKEHERLYSPTTYTWRYCSNTGLKCYDMPQDLLSYVNMSNPNAICNVHNCPPGPGTDTCGHANEYAILLAKPTAYRALYDRYVGDFQSDAGVAYVQGDPLYPGVCTPLSMCTTPVTVRRDYRICGDVSEPDPARRTIPDGNCDATGPGSQCQGTGTGQQQGFCFRTVDCAIAVTDPICVAPSGPAPLPVSAGTVVDHFDSWFYRPHPPSKATKYVAASNSTRLSGMQGAGNGSHRTGAGDGSVRPGLCYTSGRGDWRALRAVTGRRYDRWQVSFGLLGTLTIEFYYYDLFEDSISPGVCGMGSGAGNRGTGYIYLKGTSGLLYNDVDHDTMYFEGTPATNFDDDLATHTVKLCLRFKNTLCVQCEGARECVPTAGKDLISSLWTQICGRDLCRTFTLPVDNVSSAVNPQRCMMRDGNGGMDGSCSSEVDSYLRMRAVYYDSVDAQGGVRGMVCGFLDAKGHLAYQPSTFGAHRGNEHIGDNYTCENDTAHEHPNCNGFDSASDPGLAHKWRTVLRAQYIGNNQPAGSGFAGYYDRDGLAYPAMHCAPVRMRVGSGLIYNLANVSNSPTIFNPPLIVRRVNNRYGGTASSVTDFHRPEIMVQYGVRPITTFADGDPAPTSSCFGSTNPTNCPRASDFSGHNQVYLSLDAGELTGRAGTATAPGGAGNDSKAYATIYSEVPGVADRISTEVFLEKDYDYATGNPQVCLFEKVSDASGNYSDNPLEIACFRRTNPGSTIHWMNAGHGSNRFGLRITAPALVSPRVPNLPSAQIPSATTYATFNLLDHSTEYCSTDLEDYRFCLMRGQCTRLARECSDASAARSAAIVAGTSTVNYDATIRVCEQEVLPTCLRQRGLPSTGTIFDILDTNDEGAFRCRNADSAYLEGSGVVDRGTSPVPAGHVVTTLPNCTSGQTPFLYGWHNVVEIVRGVENRLPYVIEHRIADGRKGICQIRPTSPYLIDTRTTGSGSSATTSPNTATNCLGGGDGSNCLCVTVPRNHIVSDSTKFRVRLATPKEMGISYEIPVRSVCPTFVGSAQTPVVGELFPMTNVGSTATGTCDLSGGWAHSVNARFQNLHPRMNCIANTVVGANPHRGVWDISTLQNACIRRTCNALDAGNPDVQGNYLGTYDDGETSECRGAKHGFANWPSFTPPAGLQPEQFISTAGSCIAGFKKVGSTATTSAAGVITGYTGGLSPKRLCARTGVYSGLTRESVDLSGSACSTRRVISAADTTLGAPQAGDANPTSRTRGCVRITCPAITPTTPTSTSDSAAWNAWFASGGATYPETNASRSDFEIRPESVATGTCNNSLGFFAVAGGGNPTRECDHLGNWGPISNPCSTLTCNAVTTDVVATSSNNGFAMWNAVTDAAMTTAIAGGGNAIQETATSCATGYVQNPYPPATDTLGNALPAATANDLTRPAEMPKRYCIGGRDVSGNLYKIWRVPTNACINACPGSAQDDRMGVGRTSHNYYNITRLPDGSLAPRRTTIAVNWPATPLGQDAYVTNWTGTPSNFNASHFLTGAGNRNNLYLLKRRCGANGRWEDPHAMCALNDGVFGSATFRGPGPLGYSNSIRAYTTTEHANRASIPSFETATGVCAVPTTLPTADRARVISTLSGLTLATPVVYCAIMPGDYIDQTFLTRTTATTAGSGPITTDCGTCAPVSGSVTVPSGGVVDVTPESRNYYPSETLTGSRISCGTHFNYRGPTASSLSATCDPAGTGGWTYQNANFCRASCRVTSSILASQDVGNTDHCGDGGITYTMRGTELSGGGEFYIKDGEIFEFVANRSCRTANPIPGSPFSGQLARDYCSYWRYSMKCDNGTMLVNHNTSSSFGGCNYSRFDYGGSTWGAENLYGISQNPYFVIYRHIQRTPTLATGMGVLKDDDLITGLRVDCTRNCGSTVATHGVSSTTALSGLTSTGSSSLPSGFTGSGSGGTSSIASIGSVGVGSSIYNAAVIGSTMTSPCGNSFSSPLTVATFNLSAQSSYNPGTVIDGVCPSSTILSGAVPQITCQTSGDWALTNASNCASATGTAGSISAGSSVRVFNTATGGASADAISGTLTNTGGTTAQTTVHTRHFDLTSPNALIVIDLNTIDNHFKLSINGTDVHSLSCFEVQPEPIVCPPDPSGGPEMTIVIPTSVISSPWVRNTSGLPRVRIITNGITTQILGSRSSSSTSMENAIVSAGSIVTPTLVTGRNTVVLTVLDGQGPDSVDATITVRQF